MIIRYRQYLISDVSTFFGSYPFQKFRDLRTDTKCKKNLPADTVLYYLPTRTSLVSRTICVRSVQYLELETILSTSALKNIDSGDVKDRNVELQAIHKRGSLFQ